MKVDLYFWWDLASAAAPGDSDLSGVGTAFCASLDRGFLRGSGIARLSRASSEKMGCHSQSMDVCDSRRFHRLLLDRLCCLRRRTDVETTQPASTQAIRDDALEPFNRVQSHPNQFSARPKQ